MYHYYQALTNKSGDSLAGFYARVIDRDTNGVVTLAADENGTPIITVSGEANMAKADPAGNLSFYVVGDTYHLDIYGTDATTFIKRVPNVSMDDGSDNAAAAATSATAAAADATQTAADRVQTGLDRAATTVASGAAVAAAGTPALLIQTNSATPTTPPSGSTSGGHYWAVQTDGRTIKLYLNTSGTGAAVSPAVTMSLGSAVAITQANEQKLLPRQDLFRPDRCVLSSYIYPNGVEHYSDAGYSDYYVSGPIPCAHTSVIQISKALGVSALHIMWRDAAGAYLTTTTSGAAYTDISVPTDAVDLICVFSRAVIADNSSYTQGIDYDFKLFDYSVGAAQPRNFGRLISKTDLDKLTGKKIVFMGDSRLKNDLYSWPLRVCKELGATLGLADSNGRSDVARSGRYLAKALYRADDTTVLTSTDFADVDVVFIEHGWNDMFNGASPGLPTPTNIATVIGAWSDAASGTLTPAGVASATTMCGKLRTIIAILLGWNPRLRIVPVSAFYGPRPKGDFGFTDVQCEQWYIAWRDAQKALAESLGLLYFDHYACSGINRYSYAAYLEGDSIHQNGEPPDINSATPNGYDLGSINQYVWFLRYRAFPIKAIAGYEQIT